MIVKYLVKRAHQGDKWYAEGAKRDANPSEVTHLVERGVLVDAEKLAPAVKNKKAPPVKNKGA
tara:strand:- start:40771 stop:40959 length:189 start_codon:yes stop_codon:yes gene_type:complete